MNTNWILGAIIFLFLMAYLWPFKPCKYVRPVKEKEQDDSDDENQIFINP